MKLTERPEFYLKDKLYTTLYKNSFTNSIANSFTLILDLTTGHSEHQLII
jgi:hypothetical protein